MKLTNEQANEIHSWYSSTTKPAMKRYVFSYISFFDNVMTSKVIESDLDIAEVAAKELGGSGFSIKHNDLDIMKEIAFDGDCMFEIIEI